MKAPLYHEIKTEQDAIEFIQYAIYCLHQADNLMQLNALSSLINTIFEIDAKGDRRLFIHDIRLDELGALMHIIKACNNLEDYITKAYIEEIKIENTTLQFEGCLFLTRAYLIKNNCIRHEFDVPVVIKRLISKYFSDNFSVFRPSADNAEQERT